MLHWYMSLMALACVVLGLRADSKPKPNPHLTEGEGLKASSFLDWFVDASLLLYFDGSTPHSYFEGILLIWECAV